MQYTKDPEEGNSSKREVLLPTTGGNVWYKLDSKHNMLHRVQKNRAGGGPRIIAPKPREQHIGKRIKPVSATRARNMNTPVSRIRCRIVRKEYLKDEVAAEPTLLL